MRNSFLCCLCFFSFCAHAQSNLYTGEIAVKWDVTRLANPFNSTIQLGAEIGLNKSLTIQADIGVNSNLFKSTRYNSGIFISHNQLRKYKRDGHFYGLDFFYIHAKDFSNSSCVYDKNEKISADYDSVMLIKNAPGIAVIAGRQLMIGKFLIDMYCGGGLRLVNNKLEYSMQTPHNEPCPEPHYAWHNDKYSGTFAAGHLSLGIKLGYIIKRRGE